VTRVARGLVLALAAWLVAFAVHTAEPAGYDFIALYATARLVATGHGGEVTDPAAQFAMEHAILSERTVFLFDPNVPALALLMAPLGALPYTPAYAAMLTLGVAALLGAAALLAPLAAAEQRARLLPFALLAPPSLIALVEGQTTPFVLLALAAALRAPPFWSGALLGATALRPQLLPLFAIVALTRRGTAAGCAAALVAVAALSLAVAGVDGLARYPLLVSLAAEQLRPGELGLPALARRGLGPDAGLNAALTLAAAAIAAVVIVRRSRDVRSRTVDASPWSLLTAPHALLHDGVVAYPAIAAAATGTRATALWVGSGVVVALVQQAGVPLAPLWLLALALGPRRAIRP